MSIQHDLESDEVLVEMLRSSPDHDSPAFDALVRRHKRHVRANCRYLTRSDEHADDLAQEVFVKVYFGLSKFEGRSAFRTWLHTIKVRHCFDFLKRNRARVFVDLEDSAVESAAELNVPPNAEQALMAGAQRERIGQVLDALPETLRVPLLLRDLDGLAYQEIAGELSISLSAAKMRVMRGRKEFRRLFGSPDSAAASPAVAARARGRR